VRIVIADDSVLLREGLARLLTESGHDIVATVGDADELLAVLDRGGDPPLDIAVVDIRMPPTYTHEGAVAALEARRRRPDLAVLLLSQSIETRYAFELVRSQPARLGYLLKDHILDVAVLTDALATIASGGTVLDPDVVGQLLGRRTSRDRLARLTAREQEIIGAMAEGRSNLAISTRFTLSEKTVDAHIRNIFTKLDLLPEPDDHRRVLAVRAWLDGGAS
jgi:DNA-binding NarL/FixJ family response regulator